MSRRIVPGIVSLLVVALVVGGYTVFRPNQGTVKVTAFFPRAVSLYEGNDVRVLGISVGTITKITPVGTKVKVEFVYSADRKVPADANAVIVPPTIVSDRYIQLTPVYRSGATMKSGAVLDTDRTKAPLELDDIFSSLNDLNIALGPDGANKDGALSTLLHTSAENLGGGNGQRLHDTLVDFSKAIQTLDNNSGDLFGTISNLAVFTQAIKESDSQVVAVNRNLADVSTQLNGERDELAAALSQLSTALAQITGFVQQNRSALKTNIDGLTSVTGTLLTQKRALEEFLDTAPLAVSNLSAAYNPAYGTLDTRSNNGESLQPGNVLCALVASAGASQAQCDQLTQLLAPVISGGGGIPGPPLPPLPTLPSRTPTSPDLTLGGVLEGPR